MVWHAWKNTDLFLSQNILKCQYAIFKVANIIVWVS